MEIRRFGVGNRRPDGPPRTTGVAGQVIHADGRGVISELAFARRASVEPHSNPNTTWFVVIEGGGWVQVGDERARIAAGEAVLWPADVVHAAWTELTEMRAIVVELGGADDALVRGILDGRPLPLPAGGGSVDATAARADGELSQPPADAHGSALEGEPL
jgi:quercetin dioxygenase-like cupin family protein